MSDSSSESDSVGPVLGSGGGGRGGNVRMAITGSVTPTPASIKGKGERSETSGFTTSRPCRPNRRDASAPNTRRVVTE